ncbi:hypothetical protein ICN11_08410 [Polynucleobacter sp. 78F-HAINBA]|uniref:hypothetical protein n=1 Tax=Polynucleobacter sp. 78F-HAINBA TaxID=2689099 RepID=UPI001C0E7DE0|nr:hypothetical protein [Polynucleobacter sp. 78F-HAINBA]MBU3592037.1 hypothetical protein [Polynucleobacter sp. 78F-HAINBA]
MTQQLTKIYDLAYCIERGLNEVHLEQSCGVSEQAQTIKLNKLHVKLLAEQMKLIEVNYTAQIRLVVRTKLDELLDAISEHWGDLSNDKHVDVCHLTSAKTLYEKAQTVCSIAGCDDDSSLGEEGDALDASGSQLTLPATQS